MKLIRVVVFVFSTLLLASSAFGQQPGLVFPDQADRPSPGGRRVHAELRDPL